VGAWRAMAERLTRRGCDGRLTRRGCACESASPSGDRLFAQWYVLAG
jgi:hypothetical protein